MNCRESSARLLIFVIFFLFGSTVFSQNRKPFVVPFQSSNNIVIVETSVNGSKPLSFILDTDAGGSVINTKLAKELGLKLEGQSEATTWDPLESTCRHASLSIL